MPSRFRVRQLACALMALGSAVLAAQDLAPHHVFDASRGGRGDASTPMIADLASRPTSSSSASSTTAPTPIGSSSRSWRALPAGPGKRDPLARDVRTRRAGTPRALRDGPHHGRRLPRRRAALAALSHRLQAARRSGHRQGVADRRRQCPALDCVGGLEGRTRRPPVENRRREEVFRARAQVPDRRRLLQAVRRPNGWASDGYDGYGRYDGYDGYDGVRRYDGYDRHHRGPTLRGDEGTTGTTVVSTGLPAGRYRRMGDGCSAGTAGSRCGRTARRFDGYDGYGGAVLPGAVSEGRDDGGVSCRGCPCGRRRAAAGRAFHWRVPRRLRPGDGRRFAAPPGKRVVIVTMVPVEKLDVPFLTLPKTSRGLSGVHDSRKEEVTIHRQSAIDNLQWQTHRQSTIPIGNG